MLVRPAAEHGSALQFEILAQQAVEPGAVDQLGRRDAAQEIQRMCAVAEIAARCAGFSFFEVSQVLRTGQLGALVRTTFAF